MVEGVLKTFILQKMDIEKNIYNTLLGFESNHIVDGQHQALTVAGTLEILSSLYGTCNII